MQPHCAQAQHTYIHQHSHPSVNCCFIPQRRSGKITLLPISGILKWGMVYQDIISLDIGFAVLKTEVHFQIFNLRWGYCLMCWVRRCFQCQVCCKDEKKSPSFNCSPIERIHYLRPLRPARQKMRNDWSFYAAFEGERGQKEVEGWRRWAAGNAWPQPCPPPDLSSSPFCRAVKGKTIFSYCFIKHYVALFIAVSPDSYSIPAEAVCTAPDRTKKAHWSSSRWNMELSESVTPPTEGHHTQMCVCVCFR